MNILVANDDGIQAQGLRELVDALHDRAKASVFVCAPDGQRSAASHAITLRGTVDVRETTYEKAEKAFMFSGTPADCVVVGLRVLKDLGITIDMVFTGINHGSNLGTDTVYSGTVGSAMEGSIQGIPSVAVSVDSHQAQYFEYACDLAVETIEKTGGKWNPDIMLNINTPNLPKDQIKGIRYTKIGDREYDNDIQFVSSENGVSTYKYGGNARHYSVDLEDNDVIAIQNGYASITPMQKDMTAPEAMAQLNEWRIGK